MQATGLPEVGSVGCTAEKGRALAAAIPEVSADASLSDSVVVAGKPAAKGALADVRARFAMA